MSVSYCVRITGTREILDAWEPKARDRQGKKVTLALIRQALRNFRACALSLEIYHGADLVQIIPMGRFDNGLPLP